MTVASNYHIEVNPSDAGIYDRIVVMDLIKSAAQTHQLDGTGQREFKGKNDCSHVCLKLFVKYETGKKYLTRIYSD